MYCVSEDLNDENRQFPIFSKYLPAEYQNFRISYLTSTTKTDDVRYMYGKLTFRALHTCQVT